MHPDSRKYTPFASRSGEYHYLQMPFGLLNSCQSFEKLMEITLAGLQWSKLVIYVDDVLTYSKTVEGMLENLEEVFKRLQRANLKLKPTKCKLFQTTVGFLGYVVSNRIVSTDPKKIQTVEQWDQPKIVKQVRAFVGFCQYYRKFIKNFSSIAAPLYSLTKKHAKFKWGETCETVFCTLKERLITAPVLANPTRTDQFIIDCDASLTGTGAILSQI